MLSSDILFSNIPKLLLVVDIVDCQLGDFTKLTINQREDYFYLRDFLFLHYTIDELLLLRELTS